MKWVFKFIKRSQLIISLVIVITVTLASVYAASTLYESNVVSYDNTSSGLTSGNVQDALDELYGHVAEVIINMKEKVEELYEIKDIATNESTAGYHNSIFRGKDITSYYTDGSLYTRISSGKFTNLYVGDYIVANGVNWRIAGFDIYYGWTVQNTPHHAVIVPDTKLATARMNATNVTTGGYVGSEMYTTTLPSVLSDYITPVFSSHVLEYGNLLTNTVDTTRYNRSGVASGASSNWAWYTRKLDLMNENQVTGGTEWSSSGYETGSDNIEFPLFRLRPEFVNKEGYWYWLRSVVDGGSFAQISASCNSTYTNADGVGGVRPYFYIDWKNHRTSIF